MSANDTQAVAQFTRDLAALQGRTRRQITWLRLRQAIDRGEYDAAQVSVLCSCFEPHCVAHGEMPPGRNLRSVAGAR